MPDSGNTLRVPDISWQHRVLPALAAFTLTALVPASAPIPHAITAPTCPAPSEAALTAVSNLFDHPPQLPRIGTPRSIDEYGVVRQSDPALRQAEHKLGLTYPHVDMQKEVSLLNAGFGSVQARPFADYAHFTQGILAQAGITLHIGPSALEAASAQTPTAAELETTAAKEHILTLGLLFANQSFQEDKLARLRQIDVTAHAQVDAAHPNSLLGSASSDKGVVQYDITNSKSGSQSEDVMGHELFHLRDAGICGSGVAALNDPYYASLNKHTVYRISIPANKDATISEPPTFEGTKDAYGNLLNQYTYRYNEGDKKGAEEIRQEADNLLKPIEVMDDYSFTSIVEDKANVGRWLDNPPDYNMMLDPRIPIIRKKFLTLLARIYERAPAVIKDLALRYGREALAMGQGNK